MDRFSYRGDVVKVRRHDVVDVSNSSLIWETYGDVNAYTEVMLARGQLAERNGWR